MGSHVNGMKKRKRRLNSKLQHFSKMKQKWSGDIVDRYFPQKVVLVIFKHISRTDRDHGRHM